MNTYYFAEATQDYWPEIKHISANSYNDAIEKLIEKYSNQFDDDKIGEFDNLEDFREYMNDTYLIALSDLDIIDEL